MILMFYINVKPAKDKTYSVAFVEVVDETSTREATIDELF